MPFSRTRTFILLTGFATIATANSAMATDRSVAMERKARPVAEQFDDALSLASRPALTAGKPVRVHCERLRNPDQGAMSCRAKGTSIVVDIRLMSSDALTFASENCRGMTSTCGAIVSGVVEFTNGVTRIVEAEIEFMTE